MTQAGAAVLEPTFQANRGPGSSSQLLTPALSGLAQVDASELEQHRVQLMRYAQWLLGNREAAQDAVQETLLAALHAPASFVGRSSVRTWLFGILRHKVMDTFRRQAREVPLEEDSDDDMGAGGAQFTADGQWRVPPSSWGDPEQALNQKRFFDVLERCLDRLPKNTARVFRMREIMGMETDAICAAVGITRDNCFVMLHRARLTLRNLLERDWALTPAPRTAQ